MARWVVEDPPPRRIHLIAAGPVALILLLGQQASGLGEAADRHLEWQFEVREEAGILAECGRLIR
jgi:hypothetical protein